MIAEPTLTFTPLSSLLRIQVTRPAERTASGLYLPEIAQVRPSEGTVVSVGPGLSIPGSRERSVIWPRVGDMVIFPKEAAHEIGDAWDVLVRAESVIGVLDPDTDEVTPENDWCVVDPFPAERETAGGIVIAERSRKAEQRGVILDVGPGALRLSGPMVGTRVDVRVMMGLNDRERLMGRTVWWEGRAKAYHLAGRSPCTLVQASDIFALED